MSAVIYPSPQLDWKWTQLMKVHYLFLITSSTDLLHDRSVINKLSYIDASLGINSSSDATPVECSFDGSSVINVWSSIKRKTKTEIK